MNRTNQGSDAYSRVLQALVAAFTLAACDPGENTVTGTGPGLPQPRFRIALPSSVSVRQGQSATVAIGISRTDYTGPVFVTFSGLPTGVSAPSVSSTSTNQFNIPLVADSAAAIGLRTVTVTATGIDVASQTGTFGLSVAAR